MVLSDVHFLMKYTDMKHLECDKFGLKEGTASHINFSCKVLTHTDIT